jgi:cephalosporin-C deacetylase-like acetyl esterase
MLSKYLKSALSVLLTIFLLCSLPVSAHVIQKDDGDPFATYLNSVPKILQIISEIRSGSGDSAIVTREVVYSSKNNINKVYAIMAFPQKSGKYPALLVLHGGSGNASGLKDLVEKYARKGYVSLACDMPGYCNIEHTPYSSGPWKVHPAPDERPRFNVADGVVNSSLVDAEVSGIEGFNLLVSQPNVDEAKIGITGYSWGGYSTTFISGLLGKRIKAAYSYWGCGFYEKGSFWKELIEKLPVSDRATWLKYFDAGRRASNIKANYFIEAAPNDTFFWPPAVAATLDAIKGEKNHTWGPNVNHTLTPTSDLMQEVFFDHQLKGVGAAFPSVKITKIKQQADGSKVVSIKTFIPRGVKADSINIYYSEKSNNWQKRKWLPIKAVLQGGNKYRVVIPADIVNRQIDFYAYLIDSRKVSVASFMY